MHIMDNAAGQSTFGFRGSALELSKRQARRRGARVSLSRVGRRGGLSLRGRGAAAPPAALRARAAAASRQVLAE